MSDSPTADMRLRRIDLASQADLHGLAEVLLDCVEGGAPVGFMHPLPLPRAIAYWRGVADSAARGERVLLVAEDGDAIVGTVQLVLRQPENQPHRAELAKMLVHRRARRRGVGTLLMQAAEDAARAHGKTLLVLDTASPEAGRLCERAGWTRVGTIPGDALWPRGGLCDTTVFYLRLA
jgi:GNAT superfamily N-acetyltransferase